MHHCVNDMLQTSELLREIEQYGAGCNLREADDGSAELLRDEGHVIAFQGLIDPSDHGISQKKEKERGSPSNKES